MEKLLNPDLIKIMFEGIAEQHTKLFDLAAVWMPSVVKTSRETKRRLVAGDEICLSNDIVVNCYGGAEWKIIKLQGTLDNSVLKMTLENLIDKTIKTIDV